MTADIHIPTLINRVLDLDKKATPGPWSKSEHRELFAYDPEANPEYLIQLQADKPPQETFGKNNADLIVEYRSAAPALVQALTDRIVEDTTPGETYCWRQQSEFGPACDRKGGHLGPCSWGKTSISELQTEIHQTALKKGWWVAQTQIANQGLFDSEGNYTDELGEPVEVKVQRSFGELIALCHSELSEALEAFREGGMETWRGENNKPEGMFVELANCIIRILDISEHFGVNMEVVIKEKMEYNQTRPYRHGGKRI